MDNEEISEHQKGYAEGFSLGMRTAFVLMNQLCVNSVEGIEECDKNDKM